MARLPQPGSDSGTWGDILNEFLTTVHKTDGTLKDNIVTSAAIAPNAVDASVVKDGVVSETKLDAALQAKVNGLGGGGALTLAGDVSGLSNATTVDKVKGVAVSGTPTNGQVLTASGAAAASWQTPATAPVTSVAGKTGVVSLVKADVGLGNVDNTSDANKPVSSSTQTALNAKADDSAVVHMTGTETVAGVKTFSSSPVVPTPTTNTQAANKSYVDGVAGAGAPDATVSTKGIVQLAGDLAGTAAAPTVAKLNGVSVSGTPSAGQVLKATGATAATWQADATGGGGSFSFRSVSGNTTAANGEFILADATSAGITVTLPVASNGAAVRVKRMSGGANSVQVVPQAPALIDGSGVGSHVLGNQWDSMEFISDGTNWYR